MPPSRRRATLATVAASAGVSVATVSKVLNGRSDVAPETRSLVLSLLEQHDYVAPPQRRGEVAPDTIEVEFDADLNAYSTEIVQGAVQAGADLDVAVVVSIRRNADRTAGWARELVAAGRRALVAVTGELTSGQLAALSRARLPLVVIDPLNLPRARVTSVGSTNFAGGLAATQHLLGLGHRRVAYLGGPATATCNQARLHGYRAAMEAGDASVLPGYVRTGHFHYHDGMTGGTALLDLPEAPSAIFAGCDDIALGVLEAARARGLRVPEDLSIVGFDDTQIARMASPPLTTVRQPLREMGAVAVRTALRLAAGEQVESHHVELATELVVRGSTAPAHTGW
ncbi:LacI family DNA-binding transcriptional regulator [Microbispora bryophytorum]|uniref:LacI family transcriptional regulator n=1 Tax=Microbispora bryophytorum TaxID=1460882 RepID=A0A8H9GX28_9ACTN|nr:LacI family DNA-binding transcriptional regulator [Microbispora bryophytorum]MBD3138721.1 LacI family DNA-binding transcriptional regulator [Microbispora bryophytorum]TQS03739.1 LacI family transcriptional regulator [Microbispora bryophytorum]GGO02296.1 LacI family transcriptional regulator [Microbispora bryophytorum]